jgi:hypothetical protein
MTKRGGMIILLPMWNGCAITKPSNGPYRASTRGSWMVFVSSTLKERKRLRTATSYKASLMKYLNRPRRLSKRRR